MTAGVLLLTVAGLLIAGGVWVRSARRAGEFLPHSAVRAVRARLRVADAPGPVAAGVAVRCDRLAGRRDLRAAAVVFVPRVLGGGRRRAADRQVGGAGGLTRGWLILISSGAAARPATRYAGR